MRHILRGYQRIGVINSKPPNSFKVDKTILKKPLLKQTPGRHNFYRAEGLYQIPKQQFYRQRQHTKVAQSTLNLKYLPQVTSIANRLLHEHVGTNHFKPLNPLSLNMTLQQIDDLINSQMIEQPVQQQDLNNRLTTVQNQVKSFTRLVEDQFGALGERIREIYEQALAMIYEANKNLLIIYNMHENQEKRGYYEEMLKKSQQIKKKTLEVKIQRWILYNKHFPSSYAEREIKNSEKQLKALEGLMKNEAQKEKDNSSSQVSIPSTDLVATKLSNLQENADSLSSRIDSLSQYCSNLDQQNEEKQKLYQKLVDKLSEKGVKSLSFRTQLLKSLAAEIVVTESHDRYQKEQHDRYVFSQTFMSNKGNMTLEQFCLHYASLINFVTAKSYNFREPKIEANYDDYGEKTIKPFNAYVMYFLLRGDKFARFIGQLILSAARYPSQKLRKAYMSSFS